MREKKFLLGVVGAIALGGSVLAATPDSPRVPKPPETPKIPDAPKVPEASNDKVREARDKSGMTETSKETGQKQKAKSRDITSQPKKAAKDVEKKVKDVLPGF